MTSWSSASHWLLNAGLLAGLAFLVLLLSFTKSGRAIRGACLFTLGLFGAATFALELNALWAQIAIIAILFLLSLFFGFAMIVSANSVPHLHQYVERIRTMGTTVALLNLVAAFVGILVGFAALQALLFQHGAVVVSDGSSEHYLDVAVRYYLWQLADAVPALDIPDTLNFQLEPTFEDHLSGSLALLFRALVVFAVLKALGVLAVEVLEKRGLLFHPPSDPGAS